MGWSPRSKMAEMYNKRHIQEQSAIISNDMHTSLGPVFTGELK